MVEVKKASEEAVGVASEGAVSEYSISEELEKEIKEIFGAEKSAKLIAFYNDLEAGLKPIGNEFSLTIDCPEEKTERGRVHGFVREKLINMDSETIGDNKLKSIRVFFTKTKAKRGRVENKNFTAVLFKNGVDGFSAMQNIGKYLRLAPRNFGTAGIKDKRGITSQLISITMSG